MLKDAVNKKLYDKNLPSRPNSSSSFTNSAAAMLKITKYGPYNMAVKMFQRKFSALANDIFRRYFHSLCKYDESKSL